MNIHSTRIKVFILIILFSSSVLSMVSALRLRTAMPGSFLPPHKIFDGRVYSMDVLYVEDVWVLVYVSNGSIHVLTSPDGKTWSEIAPPQADTVTVSLLRDLNLIKDSENHFGIVWVDRTPEDKPWESTFFLSMADIDSRTWSEPCILFQRKEGSFLNDALLLDDGTLLLMWEEPVTKYIQNEGRTTKSTSSYTAYRAVVHNEEVHIEELIEPDRPSFYFTEGASFVQDEKGYIQCIFHYHNGRNSFFKSESTDSRTWGPPEPFPLSGAPREFIYLEEGEIGALRYSKEEIALGRSEDWEKWEEDLLIRIDEYYDVPLATTHDIKEVRILGAATAKDSDGVLWVAFRTQYGVYISHYSRDLDKEQQETKKAIEMRSLFWNIGIIVAGLLFFWMWKTVKVL